jgi:hypothetical protein
LKSINEFAERNYLYVGLRILLTIFLVIYMIAVTCNNKASVPDALELLSLSVLIFAFMVRNAIKNISINVKVTTVDEQTQGQQSSYRGGKL